MKTPFIATIFLALIAIQAHSQAKNDHAYVCDNGKIHFYASTPIEDIEATSNNTVCVINTQTKKISARVQMKTFEFRRKKMQDDFNEDYAESSKYPTASIDAVISNNVPLTTDGTYDVTLKGTLEIHGVKKPVELKGKLTVKNGAPSNATAEFNVKLADYNFKIPTIVIKKIAEVVKVDVNFDFRKYGGNI